MIIGILYLVHVKVEQIYNGNMKNFHKDGMQINKNYIFQEEKQNKINIMEQNYQYLIEIVNNI